MLGVRQCTPKLQNFGYIFSPEHGVKLLEGLLCEQKVRASIPARSIVSHVLLSVLRPC